MFGSANAGATYAAPAPASGPLPNNAAGAGAGNSSSANATPWVLLGLLVAFLAWAVLEHHYSRLRDAVRPQAIGLNLRNMAVLLLGVVVGVNALKIAAAKYQAVGGPGAATITNIIGNV